MRATDAGSDDGNEREMSETDADRDDCNEREMSETETCVNIKIQIR